MMGSSISNLDLYFYFTGYFSVVFLAGYVTKLTVDEYWYSIGWKGDESHKSEGNERPGAWVPNLVGYIERILYTSSLLSNNGEFIGVWLALKVATSWKGWETGVKGDEKNRIKFQVFLIGNGLSVFWSGIAYFWISYGVKGEIWMSVLIAGSGVGFVLLFLFISEYKARKEPNYKGRQNS